jgi:hypothetical protein
VTNSRHARAVAALLTSALVGLAVGAAPALGHDDDDLVLTNGGFERGTFASWGHRSQVGSNGRWRVDQGSTSPISNFRIPAPPQGRFQAVADQGGPGSNLLFRRIEVDDDDLALRLTFWYRNRAGVFFSPRTLRFDQEENQQFRIDIMRAGSPVRSLAARDILATPFRTTPGSRFNLGPRTITIALSRFEDRDVRLRIAEVDNQFFFQAGVDAVRLVEVDDDGDGDDDGDDLRATQLRLGERQARPAPVAGAYVR